MADPALLGPSALLLALVVLLVLAALLIVVLRIVNHILSEHQPSDVQQPDTPKFHMQKLRDIDILELYPYLFAER